jgi:hypothetical protein
MHCTCAGSDRVVRRHPGHGRIVFGRFDPAVGDFHLLMVTPDGTDEVQLLPGVAECPRWSPDGNTILVCVTNAKGLIRLTTLQPDGSGFTLLDTPTLNKELERYMRF